MEMSEQLATAQNELKIYKDFAENCNAEKIALDQTFVETLKSLVETRKNALLKDEIIRKLKSDLASLEKEKEVLNAKLSQMGSSLTEKVIDELTL